MLASLVPGLRDVRAPLAAGYLWMIVAWIAFEPAVPEREAAEGVLASIYRVSDVLSAVGVGVALSFAAYLLGSLSASTLTPLLRRLFPRAWSRSTDQDVSVPRAPLSPQAEAALSLVVRNTRDQVMSSLALTDWDPDRFLAERTGRRLFSAKDAANPHAVGRAGHALIDELLNRDAPVAYAGPGSMEPVDVDAQRDLMLARAVLQDLDIVAQTRLLGRDQELYAEVDRNRAAVELRLAVIPPLLCLAIAVGARSSPWLLTVLAGLGAILCWGLFRDAIRSETVANQILLQSMEDRRFRSPTLERWETQAAAEAGRGQPELLRLTAANAAVALRAALRSLVTAGVSEPALALDARNQVDKAKESVRRVATLFPSEVADKADRTVQLLVEVAEGWVSAMQGHGPASHDAHELLDRAQDLLAGFQVEARDVVQRANAPDSPETQPDESKPPS